MKLPLILIAAGMVFVAAPVSRADDPKAQQKITTYSKRPVPKNPPGQPQNLGSNVEYYYIENTSNRAITVKYTVRSKGNVIGGRTITLRGGQKKSVSIDTTETGHTIHIEEADFD